MTVRLEQHGAVGVVTLDRAQTKNAVNEVMRRELWEAFEAYSTDTSVRAVVLTGANGEFCSGADVGGMGDGGVAVSLARMHDVGRISRAIYHLKKPTIAAVPGICTGLGWGIALSCDFVLAAETARFAQIFRNIALAPDSATVWLLSRLIGPMRAKELCYSGRVVRAEEALRLGLVLEVLPPDDLLARTMKFAEELAAGPSVSFALTKKQADLAATLTFDQMLEVEQVMQPVARSSVDHVEGIAAFREKRKPLFKGD